MTTVKANGRTEFRFYRRGAAEVKVVGSFNHWNAQGISMRAIADGWWIAESMIGSGEHHFRYVADGHWFTDFAANGVEKNKYGWNSILVVPERRLMITPSADGMSNTDETRAAAVAA